CFRLTQPGKTRRVLVLAKPLRLGGSVNASGPSHHLERAVVARAERLTSRVIRTDVLVQPPKGEAIRLTSLAALVWLATETPSQLGELAVRVRQLALAGGPWSMVTRRPSAHSSGADAPASFSEQAEVSTAVVAA